LRENKYITGNSGVCPKYEKPCKKGRGAKRETISFTMHSISLNFMKQTPENCVRQ